jgi:hypothetical protein
MEENIKYYITELLDIKQQLNDLMSYAEDNMDKENYDFNNFIDAADPLDRELENLGVDVDKYFMGHGLIVKGQKIEL